MNSNSPAENGQLTIKLKAWLDGNDEAGKEIFELSYQRLINIASVAHYKVQGLSINPREVVHESYEKLQIAIKNNPPADSIGFYNLASHILHSTCVDLLRKKLAIKRRHPTLQLQPTGKHSTPDHSLFQLLLLLEELENKHPRQAQSFKMNCVIGFTIEETAELTGMAHATVSRDINFARHWLAAKLS